MDGTLEKFSIKNLLFTKAIPNHEIPVPVIDGHKIYACTDCGDKFLFESSYEDHINRKSVLITYICRHCATTKIFYNRCKLLFHIRSHTFKTATINVQDLKVDPVPLGMFKHPSNLPSTSKPQQLKEVTNKTQAVCFECKHLLPHVGFAYKDRAAHFMQYTNMTLSCPVCLFTLPTTCALKAHMRFHLKYAPYVCPECGINITNKNIHYPFNHDCEGFRMMRATARLKCPIAQCPLYHPNEFKDHMKVNHIKKVFKCPICVVACFNEITMQKHLKTHVMNPDSKALIFYQCELCPGRLVLQNHIDNHLRTHVNNSVYPCWSCGTEFKEVFALIDHHVKKHDNFPEILKSIFTSMIHESENQLGRPKRVYRVVKRCDQCKRNFTYKCKYNEIPVLPNECPYKCTTKLRSEFPSESSVDQILCHMCNDKIPYDWKDIKKHYAVVHKNLRCLEPTLVLKRIDLKKYMSSQKKIVKRTNKKRKRQMKPLMKRDQELSTHDQNEITTEDIDVTEEATTPDSDNKCGMCDHVSESKEMLETHFKSHRDPCMAYQCLECGQSFVVKPSFSKHLVLEHGINDAEEYIKNKKCYNENALEKYQNTDIPLKPLKENQCTICRDQFDNSEDLEKHFRVHGMAFLLKNTNKVN